MDGAKPKPDAAAAGEKKRKSQPDGSSSKSELVHQTVIDKADQVLLVLNHTKKAMATEAGLFATKPQKIKDLQEKVRRALQIDHLESYSYGWERNQPPTHGVNVMRELQTVEKAIPHVLAVVRGNSLDETVDPKMMAAS